MSNKSIIVVGGGPGGYVAAIRAAQLGASVKLVEREHLGGTCLNTGCIPTKCMLHSAELMEEIRSNSEALGIKVGSVEVDFPQVIAHKNEISQKLSRGVASLLKMNEVEVIEGEAKFISSNVLEIKKNDGSSETMTADAIILSTGSVNSVPPIPGLGGNPDCVDSTGALALEDLPKTMVVIGAGVIGLEIACAYASLGTEVNVVEAMDHILPMLDKDLVAYGTRSMKKLGIKINMQHPVQSIEKIPEGVRVICRDEKKDEEVSFEAEKVLVAVGRKPNTESLALDKAGIANDNGSIIVTDRMQTNVDGVYAIGDCVKGYAQLAHTASAMGEVAAETIMGIESSYDESTNPTCVYIEPEAASVGLTEQDAIDRGIDYIVGKFPMGGNGKALILNGGVGIVKIVAEAESERIIGMHIIGPRATDLISEGALAIRMSSTASDIIETIHSHPTVSETLREAALNIEKRAIHTKN